MGTPEWCHETSAGVFPSREAGQTWRETGVPGVTGVSACQRDWRGQQVVRLWNGDGRLVRSFGV